MHTHIILITTSSSILNLIRQNAYIDWARNYRFESGCDKIMYFFTEGCCQQKCSCINSSKVGYWCKDEGEGHYKRVAVGRH